MENWDEAIDMLSATHAFDQPQGGVSIDNRIIKAVAMLIDERDRYREALERIVDDYDFTAPENMLYIARDAIRGGEVENDH